MRLMPSLVVASFVCAGSGCQEIQLRERTARQAVTATDLNYQEVLDNLAMTSAQPDRLPSFSAPGTGLTNVTRSASINYQLSWDMITAAGRYLGQYLLDKQSASALASQSNVNQWNTATVLDPNELSLMNATYRRALGLTCPDADQALVAYFGPTSPYYRAMQPGWYGLGSKKDVPKQACYVGHYCDRYAWVMPDHVAELSQLTLAILNIATTQQAVVADPEGARIKKLEDEAKTLSDIIKSGVAQPDELAELKRRLSTVLGHLAAERATENLADAQLAELKAALHSGLLDADPANALGNLKRQFAQLKLPKDMTFPDVKKTLSPEQIDYILQERQRQRLQPPVRVPKNLFNPYAVPGTVAVPGAP